MRYVYLSNGYIGCELMRWLVEREGPPVGLIVHPPERGRYRDEIIAASGVSDERIFDGSNLRSAEAVAALGVLEPELGISVLFDYILKKELLGVFLKRVYQLAPLLSSLQSGPVS